MSFRFVAALILCAGTCFLGKIKAQGYLKGDFHQHTTYTDGSFTIGYMMLKNNQFGLDWWANSKHGGHAKALEALTWLKANHPLSSYMVIAHPERYPQNTRGYSIATIHEMNNIAPNICFGFESIPGHDRETTRPRGFSEKTSVGGGTYGGTDSGKPTLV